MSGASANGNGGKYQYYQCCSKKYGQAKCKNKSINKNSFENFILKSIRNHIFTEKNLLTLADDANKLSKEKYEAGKNKNEELKNRLQILNKRIQNTQTLLADGEVQNQQTILSMLADFRKEESEIKNQITKIGEITFKPIEKTDIQKYCQKTRGILQTKTLEEKREVLQSIIQKITVLTDRKMFIEYNLPLFERGGSGENGRTAGVTHGSPLTWNAPRAGLEPATRQENPCDRRSVIDNWFAIQQAGGLQGRKPHGGDGFFAKPLKGVKVIKKCSSFWNTTVTCSGSI
jgi:hypothetical protein